MNGIDRIFYEAAERERDQRALADRMVPGRKYNTSEMQQLYDGGDTMTADLIKLIYSAHGIIEETWELADGTPVTYEEACDAVHKRPGALYTSDQIYPMFSLVEKQDA